MLPMVDGAAARGWNGGGAHAQRPRPHRVGSKNTFAVKLRRAGFGLRQVLTGRRRSGPHRRSVNGTECELQRYQCGPEP
jgi:hypothetical protein